MIDKAREIPDSFTSGSPSERLRNTPLPMRENSLGDSSRSNHSRELIDRHGRRINHLRLSVTNRCDLDCVYCKPGSSGSAEPRRETLSDEQRVHFVKTLHDEFGLRQVRITGGEPLVYPHLVSLVRSIRKAAPKLTIAMTTNARLLYRYGFNLKQAGLDRINVSLDSVDPEKYKAITGGNLDDVLTGLESAVFLGFPKPRINTVVLRDYNDHDVIPLVHWAMSKGFELRFLEAMPIGPAAQLNRQAFVSSAEVLNTLRREFDLEELSRESGETAQRYSVRSSNGAGVIGVISPVSEPFCASCRRIRLTADGKLYPCLLDNRWTDLGKVLQDGDRDNGQIEKTLFEAVQSKAAAGHEQTSRMISIGG